MSVHDLMLDTLTLFPTATYLTDQETVVQNMHGFRLPGATEASTRKLKDLLGLNHQNFDVFFDTFKHNHMAHQLLADYSMGASPSRLQATYDYHTGMLVPRKPTLLPAGALASPTVFNRHIGQREYSTDYLLFFESEIKRLGFKETLRYYFLQRPLMLRGIGAVYHGLIHIGYAVEYNLPQVLAEGLAISAVDHLDVDEHADYTKIVTQTVEDNLANVSLSEVSDNHITALDVFERVIADSDGSTNVIEKHCALWQVQPNKEDIKEKVHQMYVAATFVYGATSRPNKPVKLDFFLQQAMMLKYHLRYAVFNFVSVGRPAIHRDVLLNYPVPHKEGVENPWLPIIAAATENLDMHTAKVIRSLGRADLMWGDRRSDNAFLKAAQMTVDTVKPKSLEDHHWLMTGIGKDRSWNEDSKI
ncbi:hypothetical protein DFQ28_004088 [Apophysomyces sp. BC1034]|nr:hypothetical protein DFQ29_004067 [Apophysomyces sp. BC1021]KAG0193647.1 hypothetical protein DFQ28_004088 [Apophysomyces sp. BC1034]